MGSFLARIPQSVTAAVVAAVATAAIIGGYSATHAGSDSKTIYACVTKEGSVRIVGSPFDCDRMSETSLEWNQQGPRGDPGPEGPQGQPGPAGVIGSLDDMVGIPCGANGLSGSVEVSIAANGAISLSCSIPVDQDGDGYPYPGPDCNDANANVHPGAPEVENGVDDNCNGLIDDGLLANIELEAEAVSFEPGMGFAFPLRNVGTATATGLSWRLELNDPAYFIIDGAPQCGDTLAPGAECFVLVSYHPEAGQRVDAELVVESSNAAPDVAMLYGQ